MYNSVLVNVLNHANFIKNFYINYGFKISILLKNPTTPSYFMSCPLPHLCADGWIISALSLELGKAGWGFFCVGGFFESEVEINPLKCKIKAIDEVCIKKETFHVISWHCKEYNAQAEIHLSESSYGIFAYQEMRSSHAQFFYNHSSFRHSKLR